MDTDVDVQWPSLLDCLSVLGFFVVVLCSTLAYEPLKLRTEESQERPAAEQSAEAQSEERSMEATAAQSERRYRTAGSHVK